MRRVDELPLSKIFTSAQQERPKPTPSANNAREIAALVTRLLSHYWTADEPAAVRQAQIEDWLDDLGEFAASAVVEACREWRRTQSRRPAPADIRRLCAHARSEQQERLLLTAPVDVDAYARSIGWASEAERQSAIARNDERMRQRDIDRAASAA